MDVFCIDSVNIDSIEYIRDPYPVSTVLTYIVFDGMVEKPLLNVGLIRIYILTTGVVSNETNTYVRMYT